MFIAMAPERSKSLHNFTMPCLKWGNQKFLRCANENSSGNISSGNHPSPGSGLENSSVNRSRFSVDSAEKSVVKVSKSKYEGDDGEEEIEAVREKLMFDLKTAADEMRDAILRDDIRTEEQPDARPWNLRKRRAACKAPIDSSPLLSEIAKSARLRSSSDTKRLKFSLSLSRKEIEEDYKAMAGEKLPRRAKKKPRIVQNRLDSLFPGLWLREITADRYKVAAEFSENKKKQ